MKFTLHTIGVIFAILFLQALILNQIPPASTAPDTIVKVEPNATTAKVGEAFTLNVTIIDVQNLFGVEVTLHWDKAILQMVEADSQLGIESHPNGVLHEPVFIAKNEIVQEEGKYLLAGSSTGRETPAFNGSGNIARVTFNATKIQSSRLFLEIKLADKPPVGGVASPIPHTVSDGFFGPIHAFVSPTTIKAGEKVNISGFIVPAEQNVEIRIEYQLQGETNWHYLTNVTTNQQGNYFHIWQPQEEGIYEVKTKAVFEGTEETSNLLSITVEAAAETSAWPYANALLVVVIIGAMVVTAVGVYYKTGRKTRRK